MRNNHKEMWKRTLSTPNYITLPCAFSFKSLFMALKVMTLKSVGSERGAKLCLANLLTFHSQYERKFHWFCRIFAIKPVKVWELL